MNRPLVIGIGNPDRGDDGVGWQVARAVAPIADIAVSAGDPAELIELWAGRDQVIVVDAVVAGTDPGSLVVLDLMQENLPAGVASSTHGLGPAQAAALGKALGRLPGRLVLVGIGVADFTPGSSPGAHALAGVARAVDFIAATIGSRAKG